MDQFNNDEATLFEHTDKFNKALSRSNKVEIFAGMLNMITFLFFAYIFKDKPLSLPIGFLLIALAGLFIALYINRNRKIKGETPSKENKLEYFKYWVYWYENTYKLGRNVFWWYILPIVPGLLTLIIGMVELVPEKALLIILVLGSAALIVGGVVFWLNRFYSSNKLLIRIVKLREHITELESN